MDNVTSVYYRERERERERESFCFLLCTLRTYIDGSERAIERETWNDYGVCGKPELVAKIG